MMAKKNLTEAERAEREAHLRTMTTTSSRSVKLRERFALTLHGVIYRLILGAIVLAIVIPASISGHQPMWPYVLLAIVVVIVGILVARQPRLRAWLRRR